MSGFDVYASPASLREWLEPIRAWSPDELLTGLQRRVSPMIEHIIVGVVTQARYRINVLMWTELPRGIRTELLADAQKLVAAHMPAPFSAELVDVTPDL